MTKNRWTKAEALSLLERGRWFGSLAPALRDRIIDAGEIVLTKANSALYSIGDPVDGLYASLDGDIRAYAYGDENERVFVRPFGPGTWFGDVHLLDEYPTRTFEVWTVSASNALFLSASAFRDITDSDPEAFRAFVRLLCLHMRHTMRVLMEARSEAPRRAARALLRLARAHGIPFGEGVRLAMNLSQADLASLVGVSRQYMNELIARWEAEGVLRWNGKALPVLNLDRLRTLLSPLDKWIEDSDDWV